MQTPFYCRQFCWPQWFLTSYNSNLYSADMYVFITDGYVVSKDFKLHTVFIYPSVFIYDDSSHVTFDLTFPS